jgi:hypothetical protein
VVKRFFNRRFRTALALLMLGLPLLAPASAGASPQVEISARVTPTVVTVGDPVRYEIQISHPAEARIDLPAVRGNTGSLDVLDYSVRADSAANGRRLVTYSLLLAAYDVGPDTLPPQRVEVRMLPDTAATVLYTQPTILTVNSTVPAESQDIADIHDDERLPRGFPWGGVLVAALVAGGVWVSRRLKKRAQERAARLAPQAPRVITAAEAAFVRLRVLEDRNHIGEGRVRAFAFELSEIFREYLAGRFNIDALEATTAELLERTAPLSLTLTQQTWLHGFCTELDAVKFADAALTAEDGTRLIEEVRTFLRETHVPESTRPIPPPIQPNAESTTP